MPYLCKCKRLFEYPEERLTCSTCAEIKSLRQQLDAKDTIICGMRELLQRFAWPEYEQGGRAKEDGISRIKARYLLKSSSPTCLHKDEMDRLKAEIIELEMVRCEACIKAERSQLQCIICEGPFTFYDEPCHKCFTDLHAQLTSLREVARALELILPLAKGYVAHNPVGHNQECIKWAVDALSSYDSKLGKV